MKLVLATTLLCGLTESFTPRLLSHGGVSHQRLHRLHVRGEISSEYVPLDNDEWMDHLVCDPDFPCADKDSSVFTTDDFWSVLGIPFLTPFIAFLTFESTSQAYQSLVEFLSTRSWVAVDGGGTLSKVPCASGADASISLNYQSYRTVYWSRLSTVWLFQQWRCCLPR